MSLDLALNALTDLDSEINGRAAVPEPRPVSARALVESAVERWRTPAARAARTLELRWHAGTATVMADPRRVAQILDNLLANAIEHGGLRLVVSASVHGSVLRVVVADSGGLGVRRLASDPRRGHGLAIAARLAAANGGRLTLEQGPGGTIAGIELPLAPTPLFGAARRHASGAASGSIAGAGPFSP
jgi:two-component system sensor histidine kinase BaeS